ncbi:MAG: hypothetical protein ACXACD_13650 [Candidatus Thorarchaeota archaeon]
MYSESARALTISDLRAMYAVAGPEDKALLALGVSLGWRAGDFVQLQQAFCQDLLSTPAQAGFRYFRYLTSKEQVTAYCVLSPCAAPALQHYLTWKAQYLQHEQELPQVIDCNHLKKQHRLTRLRRNLWTITSEKQLNRRLRQLFQQANLTAGRRQFSWHCLRDYVMTSLNRELGLMVAKKLVGKTVSESAYLHLEQDIEDKYPQIYQACFNLDLASVEAEHNRELLSVAQTELKADLYDRQQAEQQLQAQLTSLQAQLLQLQKASYSDRLYALTTQQSEQAAHLSSLFRLYQEQPGPALKRQITDLHHRAMLLQKQKESLSQQIKALDPAAQEPPHLDLGYLLSQSESQLIQQLLKE